MTLLIRASLAFSVLSLAVVAPSTLDAQTLTLQIRDGQVTLDARGVSIRRILDEWAHLGQVTIINADALASTPTTIVLNGVSERTALDTLLRDSRGYILGPRQASSSPTEIDRIFVISGAAPVRGGTAPARIPLVPPASVAGTDHPTDNPTPLVVGGGVRDERIGSLAGAGAGASFTPAGPPGNQGDSGIEAIEDRESTIPTRSQTPLTPILRPPVPAPDAQHPFGQVPGSAVPGVVNPVGPPPGFAYPPVTNPNAPVGP